MGARKMPAERRVEIVARIRQYGLNTVQVHERFGVSKGLAQKLCEEARDGKARV